MYGIIYIKYRIYYNIFILHIPVPKSNDTDDVWSVKPGPEPDTGLVAIVTIVCVTAAVLSSGVVSISSF